MTWSTSYKTKTTMKLILKMKWNLVEILHQELLYQKLATHVTLPASSQKATWNICCKMETTMKPILMLKWNVVEFFHRKLNTKWSEAPDTKEKDTMTLISNVKWKVLSFTIKKLSRMSSPNRAKVLLAEYE